MGCHIQFADVKPAHVWRFSVSAAQHYIPINGNTSLSTVTHR